MNTIHPNAIKLNLNKFVGIFMFLVHVRDCKDTHIYKKGTYKLKKEYDAREIFREQIIEYFVREYMVGHTPVPCTLCNNYLKWPLLSKIADEMGIF